ncbi:hypothetical protein JL720_13683 [Aureococcus anophagefferens]|nr:hypothetical protein JL720_13683 [Aureococcus anophagefferens]
MLPGMLENHYAEEGSRALRAASTQRAVVPRERRFVDQDMGQAYLVGGSRDDAPDGAWACMTHMPYKAPARAPRPAPGDVAPARAPSPPRYDASAEAQRLERLAADRSRAARLKPAEHRRESPFATADFSTARGDDATQKPRGRHRHELAERSNEPARRGRRGAPEDSRADKSVFTGGGVGGRDGGEGLMCAALGGLDAFAIGNPRAETFHLRTRSTKRVGITPASHEHNEQYYKDRAPGRKVFADQHGGGASSVGFSDGGGGGLSAALSPGKAGKKAVARSPPKQESRAHGRKHGNFERDALDAGALLGGRENREAPYHDERPRVTFADAPPAPSVDHAAHAAVKLVEEARADEPPAAPAPRAPPRAPPPARAAPPPPPGVRGDFVAWYVGEYGEQPPQHLVDRAATTFAVSGEAAPAAPPAPKGDDPFRGQREKLQFVEPSPAKHSGARCGAIGDSDGGKNSILGNRSIKTTRPPGGGSSINLGWD